MKKLLTTLGAVTAVILIAGCSNPSATAATEESEVTNNLSSSSGDNEVKGTYYSSSTKSKVVFGDDSATIYADASASANVNSRESAESAVAGYKYSYNSDTKTIELQLEKVWDSNNAAKTYSDQVQAAKQSCEKICAAVKTGIKNSTDFKTFCEALNNVKAGYGTTVESLINKKVESYIAAQQENLEDYLKRKYNSVIKMKYSFADKKLSLNQQFLNDLKDASSEFTSSTNSAVLNGYETLKPFSITVGETEFVGVPKFTDSTMTVDLYQYLGNVLTEDADKIAEEKITEWSQYLLKKFEALDEEKKNSLMAEVLLDKTTTIESWIDDEIASLNLTASVEIDSASPKVTLKTTKDFTNPESSVVLSSGTVIEMTYVPVLSQTVQTDDLTKQN